MRTVVRMFGLFCLMVSAQLFAGCGGGPNDVGVNVERDLGPFIIQQPGDTGDMSMQQQQPADMAMKQQQPPADMAMSPTGCGTIDTNGICNGETLEYCNSSNVLITKDCSASGKSCKVATSGYASCS